MQYIKIDKANSERKRITEKEALKLIGSAFIYPKKILKNSTAENPLNLCFSYIYKEV